MPRVLNKHRDVIPDDAVYIGRPSPWGNPFRVQGSSPAARQRAIAAYRRRAEFILDLNPYWLNKLRGKDLVCFCKPLACHGDVLLELMEKYDKPD
jgi:hypothetical protein